METLTVKTSGPELIWSKTTELRLFRPGGASDKGMRLEQAWVNGVGQVEWRPVDRWGDGVLVRAFGPRMVCTVCGIVGADARPDWREMRASGSWR